MTNELIRNTTNQKGFTLIEFLAGLFVAVVVLGGVVMTLLYLTNLSTSAKKRTLVMQDLQLTMERVSGTQLTTLNTQFPNNQLLTSSFVSNVLGGYGVNGETIRVNYPNGTSSNPREILLTGTWPEPMGTRTVTLRTYRRG